MKVTIIVLHILMMGFPLVGQSYFSKYYDLNNHLFEDNQNIGLRDTTIIANCLAICSDSDRCNINAEINIESGQLVNKQELLGFGPAFFPIYQTDDFIIGGQDYQNISNYGLVQSSYGGKILKQGEFSLKDPRYARYFLRGTLKYGQKTLLFGQVTDNQDSVLFKKVWNKKVKGLLMWINQDFQLDTFQVIEPDFNFTMLWNAKMDHDSNLVLVYTMSRVFNGFLVGYKGVNKYNQAKQLIFHWETPMGDVNSGGSSLEVFPDNSILLTYEDISFLSADTASFVVLKIDTAGKTVWEYRFPTEYKKLYGLQTAKLTKEGGVLGCGSLYNNLVDSIEVTGFMYKIDKDGQKLWERVFRLDLGQNLTFKYAYKNCWLSDLVELPNGDIVASGRVKNIYEDPLLGKTSDYDLWVIKTDKDGCMQKDCGYYQVLTAVEDLEPTPVLPFKIYPNPAVGMIEIVGAYDLYEIVDLQGQVLQTGSYQSSLDLHKFPSGMYLLRLHHNQKLFNHKIIKL